MKFIDECKIKIIAGKGGNGIISFRKEAHIAHGGPSGGDGGNGGSIYFVGDTGQNTLIHLKLKQIIRGYNGENGRNKNQYGANGKDVFIKVPLGTLVFHKKQLICDITTTTTYLIAKGGKGGKGNAKFKSSKNQVPMLCENGLNGQEFEVRIELKILADIGFVGKPSAGKSTLLSKISNAKPKIANYDFTTITPNLGLVAINNNSFVVADLPGLIEGASQGKGLGISFLKHIERCKVIAYIIDFGSIDKNPIKDFILINQELLTYSMNLEKRAQLVVANKEDLDFFSSNINKFCKKFPQIEIIKVSALQNKGINILKSKFYETLKNAPKIKYAKPKSEITIKLVNDILVKKITINKWEVSGEIVKKIYNKIPLNSNENFLRFNKLIRNIGVWEKLKQQNVKNGDYVKIFDYEFVWNWNEN